MPTYTPVSNDQQMVTRAGEAWLGAVISEIALDSDTMLEYFGLDWRRKCLHFFS